MLKNNTSEFSNPARFSPQNSDRYAVILAGGDGTRLKPLTQAITGDKRPKQFCPILYGDTLLDITQKRVALRIKPENIYYSLTQKHKRFYEPHLFGISKRQLIVQPRNRGTAPAILYSLLQLTKFAPDATVAFFPSDHYFSDDERFMSCVEKAFSAVKLNSDSIVLLGIEPQTPETAYGWIEPFDSFFGEVSSSVSRVKQFWEKPESESAQYLFEKGCLWNSFVMLGRVSTFLELFITHLPELYQMFDSSMGLNEASDEVTVVNSIYRKLIDINFSTKVLVKATEKLFVLRVSEVEWSDWGEPDRVLGTLESLNIEPDWMAYAI